MSAILRKIGTFLRLPGDTRRLILEAGAALIVGALMSNLPLRFYARWLGRQGVETSFDADPSLTERSRRVGWAIRLIASRVPFRSDCLPQAIAARIMLGRRGVAATTYLGAALTGSDSAQKLSAHAWTRSGAVFLTGNQARRGFATVAMFGYEPSRR